MIFMYTHVCPKSNKLSNKRQLLFVSQRFTEILLEEFSPDVNDMSFNHRHCGVDEIYLVGPRQLAESDNNKYKKGSCDYW